MASVERKDAVPCGKFENSLKRGQLSDVVYERAENGGHGRVCLRLLARLNAELQPPPPQLPPFVLLILSSHFTTTTFVHYLYSPLSTIYHPPSTEGVGVLSVGESLSGKVWLFNFLAREPRPPLFEETSISAPDEHFFLLPCQPSYRVTLMTVELCFPRTDYRPAD